MTERLALQYSDGSIGVLRGDASIEKAREEREFADVGEGNAKHLTNLVRVRVEVIEIIETHRHG